MKNALLSWNLMPACPVLRLKRQPGPMFLAAALGWRSMISGAREATVTMLGYCEADDVSRWLRPRGQRRHLGLHDTEAGYVEAAIKTFVEYARAG